MNLKVAYSILGVLGIALVIATASIVRILTRTNPPVAVPTASSEMPPDPCKRHWCAITIDSNLSGTIQKRWQSVRGLKSASEDILVASDDGTCWVRHEGRWVPRWRGTEVKRLFGSTNQYAINDGAVLLMTAVPHETLFSTSVLGQAELHHVVGSEAFGTAWIAGYSLTDTQIPFLYYSESAEKFKRFKAKLTLIPNDVLAIDSDQALLSSNSGLYQATLEQQRIRKVFDGSYFAAHGQKDNDVWAVGMGGQAAHWDGQGWRKIPTGSKNHLYAVWTASNGESWAVGAHGTIEHWDGQAWSPQIVVAVPGLDMRLFELNSIWGNEREVFATGAGWHLLRYER